MVIIKTATNRISARVFLAPQTRICLAAEIATVTAGQMSPTNSTMTIPNGSTKMVMDMEMKLMATFPILAQMFLVILQFNVMVASTRMAMA